MAGKSMIIIGAGLAGLSTGCYAQMNGYRTKIFEHAAHPGGLAVAWRRREYLIDGGIHFLMGPKPGNPTSQMYRELGTARSEQLIPMDLYGRCLDQTTGRKLDLTKDLGKLERDLKALSRSDAEIIERLFDGVRRLRKVEAADFGMGAPSEVLSVSERLKLLWSYRKFIRFMVGRYSRPMSEFVKDISDPFLKFLLLNLFLPEAPVWFVLMVLRLLEDGQMALLAGGCESFVRPIEQRYKDLGGEIVYEATVDSIMVENDTAVGVKLRDGTEHRANIVVSAADGYSTIFDLLDGKYVNKRIKQRYDSWRMVRPVVMVSYGIDRVFEGEPWVQTIKLAEPVTVGPSKVDAFAIRILNYSDKFAPPGKTVVQVLFESEWEYWDDLHEDLAKYNQEKERVSSEILRRLESLYPGMASQVDVTDVATPFTTWRYTLNRKGSYMGWLPTSKQLMTRIENSLPGLSNFYMVGQWASPGGGVPPSMLSGRNLIRVLCHRERRPFRSSKT